MKKIFLFLAAVAAMTAVACKPAQEQETKPEDSLTIGSSTIAVSNAGATQDIVFTTNTDWKIESDKDFITFDRTSGVAGTITVTMTVAPNDGNDPRSATVTVTSGTKKTLFKVEQDAATWFTSAIVYDISEEAQDIEVKVKYNVEYVVIVDEDSPWLSVSQTKAALEEGVIKIRAAANTQLGPRTGSFTVAGYGFSQTYLVKQSAAWTPATKAAALYISNSQAPYDAVNYYFRYHQQYVLGLGVEDEVEVCLVLNKNGFTFNAEKKAFEGEYAPVDVIPEGTFAVDAAGNWADNTFSIKSAAGKEVLYTSILFVNGDITREVVIVDGEIGIEKADDIYTVTAALIDINGNQYNYSYEGEIEIESDFWAGYSTVDWKNTYDTYFTTKANGWKIQVYLPRTKIDGPDVRYASFTFFTAAGEVDMDNVPAGTYKYAAATTKEGLSYKTGISDINPGQMTDASITLYDGKYFAVDEPGDLIITEVEGGARHVKFTAKGRPWSYDDSYSAVYEDAIDIDIDIDVPFETAIDNTIHPADDADTDIVSLDGAAGTSYVGFWYGGNLGSMTVDDKEVPKPAITEIVDEEEVAVDCNLFSIGSNSNFNNTWSVFLSLVAPGGWHFAKTYPINNPRFCETPVPDGTYTFGTEVKIGALLPLYLGKANRCYATNTYTGTTYYPVSGTVTLSKGNITLDLTLRATEAGLAGKPESPAEIHLAGSTPFTCQYLQDYSALSRVKTLSVSSPVPLD